jgi:hypothetical protein
MLAAAVTVEDEDPIFRPGLADGQEHEHPPEPRMERVRHPNTPPCTIGIRRI